MKSLIIITLLLGSSLAHADMPLMKQTVTRGKKAEALMNEMKPDDHGRRVYNQTVDCDGITITTRYFSRTTCADRQPLIEQGQEMERYKCVGSKETMYNANHVPFFARAWHNMRERVLKNGFDVCKR